MEHKHRCEAMPTGIDIWRPHQKGGRWRLYVGRGICYIRFCPFCGAGLGRGRIAAIIRDEKGEE